MPQASSTIDREQYLRALVIGPPKIGKTSMCVSTAPGMVYVINTDMRKTALAGAKRRTSNFEWDAVADWNQMQTALRYAHDGVKAGRYKTIVLDTLSSFSERLVEQCLAATDSGNGPDGRRAYPDYERRLRQVIENLFHLDAHVIVISHYIELRGEVDESKQMPKSGDGLVPLLAGKARATIPMLFDDVIFMDYVAPARGQPAQRVFVTNPEGAWGPGSRSLESSDRMPADIGKLLEAFSAQASKDAAASPANGRSARRGQSEARR
jgi:hypothetical protein